MPRLSPFTLLTLLGVFLVALNLRAPFTSLAPVLEQIMESLSLSAAQAGFVTALPLISLAVFSSLAPKLAQNLGLEKALVISLFCVALGVTVRSMGLVSPLYLGTVVMGAGIAFGNVLLPAVVKKFFPERISEVSSLYIFVMGVGSTLAASVMVPLSQQAPEQLFGWQFALAFNLIFPLAALLFWLPKLTTKSRQQHQAEQHSESVSITSLLPLPVAWFVTLALGINSFTFYAFAGWLPKILNDVGYSELDAGYIYGFLQFSTMVPGLVLMPILAKLRNHTLLITLCASSVVFSLLGMILAPGLAILWVGLFGLSNCATFIVALSFIGHKTTNTQQAAALSGMSQSFGYALAATGPSLIGFIHTSTGTWSLPLLIIALFGVACTVFCALAAKGKRLRVNNHN
ncbi:MFS transporter [Agarivorans sp. B2Z047]|uniref:MFS transporter n=1 Tax=Agarivorans sp. B2Z047 TaxID=2652721 RepID=UPI00128DDA2E|nr:MFS transporter [Agarivorans sp. B2Z047]MPW29614.1 MFS transporter [Agarivorans sp. B2Z047]UQN45198.1 MFS transporter [Agarivorans sp. B2Z047]